MKIEKIPVGCLQANCYIVTKNDKSILIDPGDEGEKIKDFCKNKNVVEILVTHNHFDHIGALKDLEEYFQLQANVRSAYFDYEIILTPGHTRDSKSFYFKDDLVIFTGDFLFKGTIGRTDLPTGSEADMINSLEKIMEYPNELIVYPGHGDSTILGKEKEKFSRYF